MTGPGFLGARRLREVLDRHGVRPHKSLGQNFVIDPNTIRKVLRHASVGPGDTVLEIGAGAGSLTLALSGAARQVIAVEKDPRLIPVLEEVVGDRGNVEIVNEDAQRFGFESSGATKVVANLPYNIAVTLILLIFEEAPSIAEVTVMTQREAGERLAAGPGSKVYGSTSVIAQLHADVSVAGSVSRNAFWPVPNVDSVIVHLRRKELPDVDMDLFLQVVHAAFGQRRKMLRNALGSISSEPEQLLQQAGLDPSARAEDVPVDGFVALARAS